MGGEMFIELDILLKDAGLLDIKTSKFLLKGRKVLPLIIATVDSKQLH